MGYFPVRYDSRVVIYEHKMFIRLATGHIVLVPINFYNKNMHMIRLLSPELGHTQTSIST